MEEMHFFDVGSFGQKLNCKTDHLPDKKLESQFYALLPAHSITIALPGSPSGSDLKPLNSTHRP
jgi:hypothetical protein